MWFRWRYARGWWIFVRVEPAPLLVFELFEARAGLGNALLK